MWAILGAVAVIFIATKLWGTFRNWATREWIRKNLGKDVKQK